MSCWGPPADWMLAWRGSAPTFPGISYLFNVKHTASSGWVVADRFFYHWEKGRCFLEGRYSIFTRASFYVIVIMLLKKVWLSWYDLRMCFTPVTKMLDYIPLNIPLFPQPNMIFLTVKLIFLVLLRSVSAIALWSMTWKCFYQFIWKKNAAVLFLSF